MCFFSDVVKGPGLVAESIKKFPPLEASPHLRGLRSGGSGWVRDTSFSRLFSLSTQNGSMGFECIFYLHEWLIFMV